MTPLESHEVACEGLFDPSVFVGPEGFFDNGNALRVQMDLANLFIIGGNLFPVRRAISAPWVLQLSGRPLELGGPPAFRIP